METEIKKKCTWGTDMIKKRPSADLCGTKAGWDGGDKREVEEKVGGGHVAEMSARVRGEQAKGGGSGQGYPLLIRRNTRTNFHSTIKP